MGPATVAALTAKFAEKHRQAHDYLQGEMKRLGLLEENGWSIAEIVRECPGGSELVLRPIHRKLEAPAGLECIVWFVEEAENVGAECMPAIAGAQPAP